MDNAQEQVPGRNRKERYSRQTKTMVLAQMRRVGIGHLGPSEMARLITPHCSPSTPRRWLKEQQDASEGREVIARMLQNAAAGRPLEERVRFAEVPPVANAQNAHPARMGQ